MYNTLFPCGTAYLNNIVEHGYSDTEGEWSGSDDFYYQSHQSQCNKYWKVVTVDIAARTETVTLLN